MTIEKQERDGCRRVIILEGNSSIARFLAIILRKSGFDVQVERDIDGQDLSGFDLAILSSAVLADKRAEIYSLRRRLPPQIILYGSDASNELAQKMGGAMVLDEFYEPEKLINTVKTAIATSYCN